MKAYYWIRNFSQSEVVNLMCYGTKFPHKLTSHQRLTRIYRHMLRRTFDLDLFNIKADPDQFTPNQQKIEEEVRKALYLKESDPVFIQTLKKFEGWVEERIDPTMVIHDCRPYSPVQGMFHIFDNDELNHDPFGYYKPRSVAGRVPTESGFAYFEDFPHESAEWSSQRRLMADNEDTDTSDFLNNQSEKERERGRSD